MRQSKKTYIYFLFMILFFQFSFLSASFSQSAYGVGNQAAQIQRSLDPQGAGTSDNKEASVNEPLGAIVLPAETDPLKIDLKVEKYVLENGLTVLLLEDHTIPMIAYHTWYKVGSKDESPGVTGAAHMLEHMMFKGSKKFPGKDFDRIFNENGIVNNAFTTYDYTGFHQTLPSSKLELVMQIEVDRMVNLNISPADLLSEREVVAEERRWRLDNNPAGMMHQNVFESFFANSNYRWPVIGAMEDINAYTSEKLRYFYESFYLPNNAVLVLVGDFEMKAAKSLVAKYYSKLRRRELPRVSVVREPPRKEKSFTQFYGPVKTPSYSVAFSSVQSSHADMYAYDLLSSAIASSGNSSRLYKELVYSRQLAVWVSSSNATMKNDGIFTIDLSLKNEKDLDQVRRLIASQIERIKKDGISSEELQKVKLMTMKFNIDQLATIDGKAESLAVNEILTGDYRSLFEDLVKYNAVTNDDIKRVARTYLDFSKRVEVVQLPPIVNPSLKRTSTPDRENSAQIIPAKPGIEKKSSKEKDSNNKKPKKLNPEATTSEKANSEKTE